MKYLRLSLVALLFLLPLSAFAFQIVDIEPVVDGVYATETETLSGETVYLGIERLDTAAARRNWIRYSESVGKLITDPSGPLIRLGTSLAKGEDVYLLRRDKAFADMTDDQYDYLVMHMISREVYPKGARWEAFNGIRGGMASFDPYLAATYVAYVSKTPITGRLQAPDRSLESYSEIHKAFGHILMTVGVSTKADHPVYEDRGIFRNPMSMIEGGYGGISTVLHVFAGAALVGPIADDTDAEPIEYMMVRALPAMRKILEEKLGVDRIRYEEDIPAELNLELAGGYGFFDTTMLVEVNDLLDMLDLAVPAKKEPLPQPAKPQSPKSQPPKPQPPSPEKPKVEKPKKPTIAAGVSKYVRKLNKRLDSKIKPKGGLSIVAAAPDAKGGQVLVLFVKKSDAEKLSKYVATGKKGKDAAPIHKQDGAYAVRLGPRRLETLFGENSDELYDALLRDLRS